MPGQTINQRTKLQAPWKSRPRQLLMFILTPPQTDLTVGQDLSNKPLTTGPWQHVLGATIYWHWMEWECPVVFLAQTFALWQAVSTGLPLEIGNRLFWLAAELLQSLKMAKCDKSHGGIWPPIAALVLPAKKNITFRGEKRQPEICRLSKATYMYNNDALPCVVGCFKA